MSGPTTPTAHLSALAEAAEAAKFRLLYDPESDTVLNAILDVRRRAAGTFTPEFSGQRFGDFDRGLMAALEAARGAMIAALEEPAVALSIRQPWAWLIVNGHKDIENRSWSTKRRGSFLVHAGLAIDGEAHQDLLEGFSPANGSPISEELRLAYTHAVAAREVVRGGIVGAADIIDCVSAHPSPWFVGEYGFVLANARPLPFMPVKGQLGFFAAEYVAP